MFYKVCHVNLTLFIRVYIIGYSSYQLILKKVFLNMPVIELFMRNKCVLPEKVSSSDAVPE